MLPCMMPCRALIAGMAVATTDRPHPDHQAVVAAAAAAAAGARQGGTALLETLDYVRHAMIGLAMLYMYA